MMNLISLTFNHLFVTYSTYYYSVMPGGKGEDFGKKGVE